MNQVRAFLIARKWKKEYIMIYPLWVGSLVMPKSARHWLTSIWSHFGPMCSEQEMQITFLAVQKVNWQAIAVAKHTCSCPCDPPIREKMHALAQGTFCVLGLLAHILIPILVAGKADTAERGDIHALGTYRI